MAISLNFAPLPFLCFLPLPFFRVLLLLLLPDGAGGSPQAPDARVGAGPALEREGRGGGVRALGPSRPAPPGASPGVSFQVGG